MSVSKVYASYAWEVENQTQILGKLEEACRPHGIKLMRDKNEIRYRESIRTYMDELAAGDAIVLVLSAAYFKSQYCMYELCEIYKRKDFLRRVFPIVVSGTRFHKTIERTPYIRHWEQEAALLDAELKSIRTGNMSRTSLEEMKEYESFARMIDELLSVLGDMNALTPDIHVGSDFAALLEQMGKPSPPSPISRRAGEGEQKVQFIETPSDKKAESYPAGHEDCFNHSEQRIREKLFDALQDCDERLRVMLAGRLGCCQAEHEIQMLVDRWWSLKPLERIKKLRESTNRCLKQLDGAGQSLNVLIGVWQDAVKLLRYVSLGLVSAQWLTCYREQQAEECHLPVDMIQGLEIVGAYLSDTAPQIEMKDDLNIHRADVVFANSNFVPPDGWLSDHEADQLEAMVYREVMHTSKPNIDYADRRKLDARLRVHREFDTANYYLAAHRDNAGSPISRPQVRAELRKRLQALPIIQFGAFEQEQALEIDEADLVAYIADFLELINPYQQKYDDKYPATSH